MSHRGGRGGGGYDRGGRGGGGAPRGRGEFRGSGSDRGSSSRGSGSDYRGGRGGGGRGRGPRPATRVFESHERGIMEPGEKDVATIQMEDAIVNEAARNRQKESLGLPIRPGYGNKGTSIQVWANSYRIDTNPEVSITRYNVEIAPEVNDKKKKRVFELLRELPEFSRCATEFKSLLVARQPLNIPNPHQVEVAWRAEDVDEPLTGEALTKARKFTVRIITPISLAVSELVKYLGASGPEFQNKLEVIQGLNALFGYIPNSSKNVSSIKGNRHYPLDHGPGQFADLRGGLEALRGYFLSVRPATGCLLLNVNVSHGVFLQAGILADIYRNLGSADLQGLSKKLRHVRVAVTHLPQKRSKKTNEILMRQKTITSFAHPNDGSTEPHPPRVARFGAGPKEVQFWLDDAGPPTDAKSSKKPAGKSKAGSSSGLPSNAYISVFDYFASKYPSIKLSADRPVVNVGNQQFPSYLPAEVCQILPGQLIKRRLDQTATQNMIRFACRQPYINVDSILTEAKGVLGLDGNPASPLGPFGFRVSPGLISIPARQLPPGPVNYRNRSGKPDTVQITNGSWNMAGSKFFTASSIGLWTVVRVQSDLSRGRDNPKPDDALIAQAINAFKEHLAGAGINSTYIPQRPTDIITISGRDSANEAMIRDAFMNLSRRPAAQRPNFVLVTLPSATAPLYNAVKKAGDIHSGIHTVCVQDHMFAKQNGQYFGNVALKFNLKAGGINQIIPPHNLGIIGEEKTMVVGLDVTHPAPNSKEGAPSIAGMVASIDRNLAQWPSTLRVQAGRTEMVEQVGEMLGRHLRLWQKHQKALPSHILIFRDGVSEGQYQLVLDQELAAMKNVCRQIYPPEATSKFFPKFTIIICGKRHHTRFYPQTLNDADGSNNCKAGTIVDRGVTEARIWDFYLQSHGCLQGSVRSGHYVVIKDEIFRDRPGRPPGHSHAEEVQELVHNMCHLFGRATKAVSLCPPAYYADLLCTRARCHLSDQFEERSAHGSVSSSTQPSSSTSASYAVHPNLQDTMFYI